MKIQVRSDGRNVTIPIPTGMIFGRPSVWAGMKIAKTMLRSKDKHIPENALNQMEAFFVKVPEESVYILCDEIMRIKRKYGKWTLLEAESEDGDQVKITL